MKLEVTVSEAKELIKQIQEQPEQLFEMIRTDVKQSVGHYLSELMNVELSEFLGRKPYERFEGLTNYRNGTYKRKYTLKGIGEVSTKIPRDRNGEFKTQVLPRSKQYEDIIRKDLSIMFLSGVSTRTLSMMSFRLIGRKISHTEVSKASQELVGAVEKWRMRDLSKEAIKYIYVDGVNFSMRVGNSIETVPVLVAIGVKDTGHKLVIGLQSGDKESASSWREFFKDLKKRGLNSQQVILGIMDGLPGLEKVFKEEFPKSSIQRCQVHVSRNVLTKVPKKIKQKVADDLRSIFYASSKEKALALYEQFNQKWESTIPSAVKSLDNSINSCLTFFAFPEEEWISLRTTNIIERLNKEFKRRTRSMEILAGEQSCYTLLAFICLKMEIHWRSNPVGKVQKNLPFFKEIEKKEFTQNI